MDPTALAGLRQPDRRSCGPSCLVAARILLDPDVDSALSVRQRWDHEVLATHRQVAGAVAVDGVLQLPWPRALGSPPWALAREMSSSGPSYGVRWARLDPGRLLPAVHAAVARGRPVPLYIGDRWLPRHVVLAVDQTPGGLRIYDPARGGVVTVSHRRWVTAVSLAGWDTPWFGVLPRREA